MVFAINVPHAKSGPGTLSSPYEKMAAEAIAAHWAKVVDTRSDSQDYPPQDIADIGTGERLLGGITPHHGLAFPMIVRFYETLSQASPEGGMGIKRIFLLSPDHFHQVRNHAAICPEDWTLSESTLQADSINIQSLTSLSIIDEAVGICAREHGITLHIPMIATYFPNSKLIPLILHPNIKDVALLSVKEKMESLLGEDTLVILSMDLSHYKTPELMALEDEKTLEVLRTLKAYETYKLDVDASRAAALTLLIFRDEGAKEGFVQERRDSSFFAGKRVESGTSYATVFYFKDQ
jgi:AmmeMemoRadiSam system protein B